MASSDEIFLARMSLASETTVQSVTAEVLGVGAGFERGGKVRGFFAERKGGARALDEPGEIGGVRAHASLRIGHDTHRAFFGRSSPFTICERIRRGSSMWCWAQIDAGFWYAAPANATMYRRSAS